MNKNEILSELSESKQTKFGKEDFDAQSLPQKIFSSIWALESEVKQRRLFSVLPKPLQR